MNAVILVSPGELIDKITILEIKLIKIKDRDKVKAVKKELGFLKITLSELLSANKSIKKPVSIEKMKLYNINLKLWNIENRIRAKEAKGIFDKEFIKLARSVYITNDKRSEVKNNINILFGTSALEVKQYSKYK